MDYVFHSSRLSNDSRVTVVGQFDKGILKIGVARCSKKDNFSRKHGRLIAFGRIAKGKLALALPIVVPPSNSDFIQIALSIAHSVDEDFKVYSLPLSTKIEDYLW